MVTVPENVMSGYLRDLIVYANIGSTFVVKTEKMQQRVRSLAGVLDRQDLIVVVEGKDN